MPAQLLITVLLIAIGWAVLIRPQQARIRQQRAMVEALEVGDRVVTAGGIHGAIRSIEADTVEVEVAPGVELTVARPAIVRRLDGAEPDPAHPGTEDHVTSSDPIPPGSTTGDHQ